MQIIIDQSKCQGHGQCITAAPNVFELDDDGFIAFDGVIDVAASDEAATRRATAACPEHVISIGD